MKFSLKSLLMLVAAVAVLILVGSFILRVYQRHAGVTRTGVSSQTANQYLSPSLMLPDAASDVARSPNMVFTQGPLSIGESFGRELQLLR